MIVSFDIDCGELVPGHHFIARGLAAQPALPIAAHWDGEEADYERMLNLLDAGGYPSFSLEYELVPGVEAPAHERNFFRYLVGISYDADVPLPWIRRTAERSHRSSVVPRRTGPEVTGRCRLTPRS